MKSCFARNLELAFNMVGRLKSWSTKQSASIRVRRASICANMTAKTAMTANTAKTTSVAFSHIFKIHFRRTSIPIKMTAKDAKVNFSLRKSVPIAKVKVKTRLPRFTRRQEGSGEELVEGVGCEEIVETAVFVPKVFEIILDPGQATGIGDAGKEGKRHFAVEVLKSINAFG